MTALDIITTTLAEVTGLPSSHFRATIMRGIARGRQDTGNGELLRELSDEEANHHLAMLRTPAGRQGVLRWVVEAGVAANQMTPAQRQRMKMYANNEQN